MFLYIQEYALCVGCLWYMHTYIQNQGCNEATHCNGSQCCQSSSASMCTGLKLTFSHWAFINLSLLANFSLSSCWVTWPQIVMTHNLRNCSLAYTSETLGLIPGINSGLKAEERRDTDRYLAHKASWVLKITVHTEQEIPGATLVKIKSVLVISHQQKNSKSNISRKIPSLRHPWAQQI